MFYTGAGRSRKGGANDLPAYDDVSGKQVALIPLLDPRVNTHRQSALGVCLGVSDSNTRVFPSNSLSQSNISWAVNPPSSVATNTLAWIQTTHTLTFTGSNSSNPLLLVGKEGLRNFPLHNQIQTFNCSINGTAMSFDCGQLMDALQRLISVDDLQDTCSGSAVMPDQYINYADQVSFGQARNVFAECGNNDTQTTRGFTTSVTTNSVSNGAGSATISVTITEPLLLPPWSSSRYETVGLSGINDININLVMGDLFRIWSRSSDCNALTGFSNTIVSANLYLTFMTPSPYAPQIDFRQAYQYQTMLLSQQVTNAGTITAGNSSTLTSNVIETGNVPSKMLIYVRRSNQTRNAGTTASMVYTDTYSRVNSLSLQVNNRSSLLSDLPPIALWRMSRRNGLNMSYQQWYKNCGGIVVVDFARDLGYVPASTERIQLQVTMNVTNLYATDTPFELYIVPFQPAVLTLKDHKCDISSSLFSPSDIQRALSQPFGNFEEFQKQQAFSGGSIFSTIGNWFNQAKDAVKPFIPALRAAVPYLPAYGQQADTMLKSVGLGMVGGRKKKH